MIKALLIDLDNCILDTRSMGNDLVLPVIRVLEDCQAEAPRLCPLDFAGLKTDLWTLSLQDIIGKYEIPPDQAEQMREAYACLQAPEWSKCYDDTHVLADLDVRIMLVTTGFTCLQQSKVRVTGIGNLFEEVIIDAIDEPDKRIGKKGIFRSLMEENSWQPHECLVMGDSAVSELKAGQELGMITVQTLRPQIRKVEGFDHYIRSFVEIQDLLALYA